MPLSGYNTSYFPQRLFRTGKCRLDSQKHEPRGVKFCPKEGDGSFVTLEAEGRRDVRATARAAGRGRLYRKGLLDGNF
jgi:hypothetical protein